MLRIGLVGQGLLEEHARDLIATLIDELHLGAEGALVADEVTQVVGSAEDAETRHALV